MSRLKLKINTGFTPHLFNKRRKAALNATENYQKGPGFTLVEVLVSLFVLGTALSAVFFIFSTAITSATVINNNFVGALLAQEGIEVMNNLKSNDWINGRPFGSFGNLSGITPDGVYRVEWNSSQVIPLGSNPNLLRNSTSGIFNYGAGTATGFTRTITIDTVTADTQIRITSSISWSDNRGNMKNIATEVHFFDWP